MSTPKRQTISGPLDVLDSTLPYGYNEPGSLTTVPQVITSFEASEFTKTESTTEYGCNELNALVSVSQDNEAFQSG